VAALVMAALVVALDRTLPPLGPLGRLLALSAAGALVYCGWLALFARGLVGEVIGVIRYRRSAQAV